MKLKNIKIIEKIINFLLNILLFIFGIILLISIYTGIQTKILGKDYNDFFGYSIFEVQTGSMEDTISIGDWIIVKLTQNVDLDDIITYKLEDEYVTHRIIEVYNGTYVTKGDANNAKDNPVDQNQVVGKVVNILANFGILRKTLFNPGVLITLIITLFLFNMAVKKNKEEASKNNKKENVYLMDDITDRLKKLFEKIKTCIIKRIGTIKEKNSLKKNKKTKEIIKVDNHDINESENSLFKVVVSNSEEEDNKLIESVHEEEELHKEEDKIAELEETEEDIHKEEELEKTSFFRVISVDSNEVDDKYKEKVPEEEEIIEEEEDLDKTSLFRVIPVDISEIDGTLLEIAENEIKVANQKSKEQKQANDLKINVEEVAEVIPDEELTKINLNLLKNRIGNQKNKNVIDIAMLIKKEELNELINVLVDEKIRTKEVTIKNTFVNTYIDAKYYNYYGVNNFEHEGRNLVLKVKKFINTIASDLVSSYHGNNKNYSQIVEIYNNTLVLIASLENADDVVEEAKVRNEFYKKEISKYCKYWDNQQVECIIDKMMQIQKKYKDMLKCFLEKLETNMFDLNFNKINSKKDMYGLALEHNISFSKTYSDYIIDKTYKEGIIAEDKMAVLLNLLSLQLIKDMTSSNFNKKYFLYIPKSLYLKEKKFEKLLKVIDSKFAKECVYILVTFEDLASNKQLIKQVRKMGYKFALVFDKETIIKERTRGNMFITDYIFINRKITNMASLIASIPDELLDNIIYEDIALKVGDFGGEQ